MAEQPPWVSTEPRTKKPAITSDERADILRRFARGETCRELSEAFNRHIVTVKRIVANRTKAEKDSNVTNEGKIQSYLENVQWAMSKAGEFSRTQKHPVACPNDSAWFLYTQATNEPKDFMAKACQIEAKNDGGEADRLSKQSSKVLLSEIEEFLAELSEKDEEIDHCQSAETAEAIKNAPDGPGVRLLQEGSGPNVRAD
jgi:hypothetical protein